MDNQTLVYEYDDIEIAKMARDETKEIMNKRGDVLKQRYYYQYLEMFYKLLNQDVGGDDE